MKYFHLSGKVAEQITFGKIIAPDEVKRELDEFGVDELAKWCNGFPHFFQPEDTDMQFEVSAIMAHPEHSKLLNVKSTSKYCADVWVIALAKVRRLIVINEEKIMNPDPNSKKNKIPNVCKDLGIDYMTFLEYVRLQSWKF